MLVQGGRNSMAVNTNSVSSSLHGAYAGTNNSSKANSVKKEAQAETLKEAEPIKKGGNYGKTVGDVKLSKEGAEYYEKLKKQFGNMDFILVSKDQKANVQANISRYTNPNKMVVLIDEDKIERMATDENYRKQYEGIIKNAASGLSQLKKKMDAGGQSSNILGYGMKVNDNGTASFFAVMKKSGDAQRARIEKKAEKKKAEKKAAEKKAEKKEKEEHIKKARTERAKASKIDSKDTVVIEANSMEELLQKVGEYNFNFMSDNVETEAETKVGHNIDFRG